MMVNNYSGIAVIKFPDFTGWTRNVHCRCTTAVANAFTILNLKLYPVVLGVLVQVRTAIVDTLRRSFAPCQATCSTKTTSS